MKVLFLGLGGAGQRHLRNLRELAIPNLEVYAVRTLRRQQILDCKFNICDGTLDEKYKIVNFRTLEEALGKGMDVVFISTPTSMHIDAALLAVKSGCHVFIEKPLSNSLDKLEEFEKYVKQNNVCVMTGYQNRFHPCILETKNILERKLIGEIISVNAEVSTDVRKWHTYEDYRNLYAVRSSLGGGVVLTQSHELDYIQFLFGMPSRVYAVGGQLSDLECDVEDCVSIMMEYEKNGKRVPIHIYEDFIQNPATRTCKIVGTKGKVLFDLMNASLQVYDDTGTLVINKKFNLVGDVLFKKELKEFFGAIDTNREPNISLHESINCQIIAHAILESLVQKTIFDIKGARNE